MGLLLLIALSILFGWCFTETSNRRVEKLQSQLKEAEDELERIVEQHAFEKKVWRKTVEELL